MKSLVLALASTTIALLIGIEVTAYLTVWPPAMSAVGDGIVIYDPEIGLVARPSAHTRHIYPAIADRAAFAFDIYTDNRGARVDGPGQQSAARYDIMTVGDFFTWAYALANQDLYAARLGRELGASVANFALASYGTTQSLQILERNLDLRPRLVVYGIIAHHFERNVWPCAPSYYEFCLDVSHVAWDDAGQPYVALPFSDGVRRLQVHQSGDYLSPLRWLTHGADVIFGRLYYAWSRSREPDDAKKAEARAVPPAADEPGGGGQRLAAPRGVPADELLRPACRAARHHRQGRRRHSLPRSHACLRAQPAGGRSQPVYRRRRPSGGGWPRADRGRDRQVRATRGIARLRRR